MRRGLPEHVTIRAALLLGFGLTLGLWLLAGYQITTRLADAQRAAAAANERYRQAQELLSTVREQVLLASVVVRDALLDPTPGAQTEHRMEVEHLYRAIDASLARYVPVLDSPAERERVDRLRQEIREFRTASAEVLATDSSRWPTEARILLRRFMPRREAAIRVSEEVQTLNRESFIDQQRAQATAQASMQHQVWTVFGVALAISLAIAGLASRHAARLEHRLTEQRAREARVSADLQRLSARQVQGQEEEQRRIARELHDDVGQALSAVKVELAVAARRMERQHGARDLLADAQSSADRALRSVRDLTHLLHPSALEDLGLVAAVDSQVSDFRRRHRIDIRFVHEGLDRRQSAEIERALYRIVQETLTNIARHARATTGRVHLCGDAGTIRAVIEDDGVGFDAADAERPGRRRGLGLLGIRERVAQLGGDVRIHSTWGAGTRIEIDVPRSDRPPGPEEALEDQIASVLVSSPVETDRG
jgi:signal transduction histidine kinase